MTLTRLGSLSLLALFLFTANGATPASAESISYPGTALKKDPFMDNVKSLYPKKSPSNNTVTINSKTISGAGYGGIAYNSVASSGNNLIMNGGTVKHGLYGAFIEGNGTASKNTVTIKGGAVYEDIVGGNTDTGKALSNKVVISGGTIKAYVAGGYVDEGTGAATSNRVTVSGKTVLTGEIHGGSTEGAGTASKNRVYIKGGTIKAEVYGGFSEEGHSKSNLVAISGGVVSRTVFGGNAAEKGSATGNKVTLSGGTVQKAIYGGATTSGAAKSNVVTISGGITKDRVIGGVSKKGQVIGNAVIMKGGSATQNLIGGYAKSFYKDVRDNSVTISGAATVVTGRNIYGGLAEYTGFGVQHISGNTVTITGGKVNPERRIYGGYSTAGKTNDNSVLLSGGTVTALEIVGGASGTGQTYSNTVSVSKKTVVKADITGGAFFEDGEAGLAATFANKVIIKGGTITGKIKGATAYGGGDVQGNSVTISGGKVTGNVLGGYSLKGNVTDNKIAISGGSVIGTIYGGYKQEGTGDVTGNKITLSRSPDLTKATLYGGFKGAGKGDVLSGNTLHAKGFSGSVKGLYNFGHYDFTLPKNVQKGSTILTVTGKKAAKMNNSVVSILGFASGAKALAKGSKITLIKNATGVPFAFNGKDVKRGATEVYNFSHVSSDTKNLVVKVASVKLNAKVASIAKNRAETLDLLTRGADRMADQTMTAVRQSASLTNGLFLFGDASASLPGLSWSSEGKVSSSLAGLGFSNQGKYGTLAFGSFFESGWTDNHAANQGGFDSASLRDKDQSSYGSGMLARFDHKNGLYAEGALRYGKAHSSFSSNDLRDGFGNKAAYDSGSRYTSFHTGIGHIYNLNENLSVDTYSKLFVTSLKGDEANVLGDKLSMQDSESRRIRSGAKFSFSLDERFTAFAGLAHEYEADGKVRANIAGHKFSRDKTRGHSAMVQAGFSFKPTQDAPLSLYVDYKNYTGSRKDANASAGLMLEF